MLMRAAMIPSTACRTPRTLPKAADVGAITGCMDLMGARMSYARNVEVFGTRLVDTVTTPMLMKTVQARKIDPRLRITHRFGFDQIIEAYETFGQAASSQALKVVIHA
jgi:alcohol dehydrogenase